jgi:uncharacterized OB-fold protein
MHEPSNHEPLPVVPGVFTIPSGDEDPVLLGGRCPRCGRDFYPRPPRCPHCLGPIEEKALGSTGRLYTYTVVRVKPPWGLPRPYGLAYVDLDDSGLRVLGLLDPDALEHVEIGLPLRLAVGEIGGNIKGEPCLRPFFRPDGSRQKRDARHG